MVPMKPLNLFLRALQVAFATIVMGLIGDMLNDYDDHSQSTVNYVMFAVAFSLATLFYLIAANASEMFMIHPVILFLVDLLNTLFIFCAAVALPSKLHVPDCSNDDELRDNSITKQSRSLSKTCREAKASTAFLWFLWFTFLLTTIFSGMTMTGGWMGISRRAHRRSSRVAPQPTMSQV
ncbi:hypothetical protein D8B26_000037 [Coccidioides posadasii str. Silveira]|uniref:Uncharacterized protein n=3 Tax=Coccidioides posadasii TaxID=199306 RepID=E9D7E1_COCPS|nr:non-classical export protein, putative [Coccidioides posadasii C735 delta SOWgp]EER25641.1 non-classical export protein, putative [Coccidioides posadasii C735 delta SOWgp]EFW17300.1 conserved hypothetical protein [Coccidioides posadasii str. Silveira]KMM71059.1 hypothetical protein CPAG_07366 [Coccidioides posadasii RMSCC 3488]QVM05328.1 hypothetical protein D8B26_000037 [Coccidioides posadasii str. Silveira]|eukprot:XP_003067786.1 non-classical export protein, putative [Coccidioides posadasii C735 delta SOWgp]